MPNEDIGAGLPVMIYGPEPGVLVCADSESGFQRADECVLAAGGRIAARLTIAEAADAIDLLQPHALLVDVSEPAAALSQLLDRATLAAKTRSYPSIISLVPEMIDAVAEVTLDENVTLLCQPSSLELTGALGLALVAGPSVVCAEGVEPASQLRQLSEEVSRIARALAQISRGERPADPALRPEASFRAEPLPFRAEPVDAAPSVSSLRALIRARRLRDQFFQPDLFADPAWDMLLDLMLARLEGRLVAVSSLCIAAAVPPTTALRWIKRLTDEGLFVRTADPRDGRRIFIDLADETAEAITAYLRALPRLGVALG